MGGDCLNYGCVPSKSLLAAAKSVRAIQQAKKFGITCKNIQIDFSKVHQHVHQTIATIAPNDSIERFTELGVVVIQGTAHFVNKKTLCVNQTYIKARRFIIATGSTPSIPDIDGLEDTFVLTNETLFDLDERPKHLIIIGGGPVGCEMAQAHRLLGSEVSLLTSNRLLPKDDPDLVSILRQQFIDDGITLYENIIIDRIAKNKNGIEVTYEQENNVQTIQGSHVLMATGRTPNIDALKLNNANVKYNQSGIPVDKRLRTSNKHIFAIGDVLGLYQFTHMANYAAGIVIKNALFKIPAKVDFSAVPWVTYTDPEIAHVGLNEEQVSKLNEKIQILEGQYAENDRATTENATRGKIKVIVTKNGQILGVSIVGREAGELLIPWCMAIKNRLKISALADIIVPYPTLSEINKSVAGQFYTPLLFSPKIQRLVRFLMKLG